MSKASSKTAQVHVRVTRELKKAIKLFCVRNETTEQTWISNLIENELSKKAPDLWSGSVRSKDEK